MLPSCHVLFCFIVLVGAQLATAAPLASEKVLQDLGPVLSVNWEGCKVHSNASVVPFTTNFASVKHCFPATRFLRKADQGPIPLADLPGSPAPPTNVNGTINCTRTAESLIRAYWYRLARGGDESDVPISTADINAKNNVALCTDGSAGLSNLLEASTFVETFPGRNYLRVQCDGGDRIKLTACRTSSTFISSTLAVQPYSGNCSEGLKMTCSRCQPYIEPSSVAQPYFFLIFPGVQLMLVVLLEVFVFDRLASRMQRRLTRYERERPPPDERMDEAFVRFVTTNLLKGGRFRLRLRVTASNRDGLRNLQAVEKIFRKTPDAALTVDQWSEFCGPKGIALQRALYSRESIVGCYRYIMNKVFADLRVQSLSKAELNIVRKELEWFWQDVSQCGERMYDGIESNLMSLFRTNWKILNVPQQKYHVSHVTEDTSDDMEVFLYCIEEENRAEDIAAKNNRPSDDDDDDDDDNEDTVYLYNSSGVDGDGAPTAAAALHPSIAPLQLEAIANQEGDWENLYASHTARKPQANRFLSALRSKLSIGGGTPATGKQGASSVSAGSTTAGTAQDTSRMSTAHSVHTGRASVTARLSKKEKRVAQAEIQKVAANHSSQQCEYVVQCEDKESIYHVIGNLYVLLMKEGKRGDVVIDDIQVVLLDGYVPPISFSTTVREIQILQRERLSRSSIPGADLLAKLPINLLPLRFVTDARFKVPEFPAADAPTQDFSYLLNEIKHKCKIPVSGICDEPQTMAHLHTPTAFIVEESRSFFLESAKFIHPAFDPRDLYPETDATMGKLLDSRVGKKLADKLMLLVGSENVLDYMIRDRYFHRNNIPQIPKDRMAQIQEDEHQGTTYDDKSTASDTLLCLEPFFTFSKSKSKGRDGAVDESAAPQITVSREPIHHSEHEGEELAPKHKRRQSHVMFADDEDPTNTEKSSKSATASSTTRLGSAMRRGSADHQRNPSGGRPSGDDLFQWEREIEATTSRQSFDEDDDDVFAATSRYFANTNSSAPSSTRRGSTSNRKKQHKHRGVAVIPPAMPSSDTVLGLDTTTELESESHTNETLKLYQMVYEEFLYYPDSKGVEHMGVHRVFQEDNKKLQLVLSTMYNTLLSALEEVDGDLSCINVKRFVTEYRDQVEAFARLVPIVTKEEHVGQKIFYINIYTLAFQVIFAYVFVAMCIYDSWSILGISDPWLFYESVFFKFVNSGTPVGILGSTITNYLTNAEARANSRFITFMDTGLLAFSLLVVAPPLCTHCFTGIVIFFWPLAIVAIVGLVPNALLWTYYRKVRAHWTADSVEPSKRRINHNKLKLMVTFIMIWFQFTAVVLMTGMIQSTYNWAFLYYRRDEYDVNYVGVLQYEWFSRSPACYLEQQLDQLSNMMQWLSSFIG